VGSAGDRRARRDVGPIRVTSLVGARAG